MAGKKRPKSLAHTEKKAPAKPKRPKKDLTRQVGDDLLAVTAYSPCASAIAPSTPERGPSAGGTT